MTAPPAAERAQTIVSAVGELHLDGNILPHEWFRHLRYPNGKPHTVAMIILSEIVYWYRPRIEKDEQTGRVLGYYKRFKGDTLQRSQPSFAEQFGFTLPQVRLAMDFLEEHAGVIRTELRDVITRGGQRLSNVLFIEVVPERLRAITIPPGIQLEEPLHAGPQPLERSVYGQRPTDDPADLQIAPSAVGHVPSDLQIVPSDLQIVPSDPQIVPSDLQLGTYTETTTETTTESTTETTTTHAPETENDVVVVLMELGLTKRQALEATACHHLTRTEVEQWRAWVRRLDPMKTRPVAILAAALKQQRLPPRLLAAVAPAEHDPPVPPADPPDAVVVPMPSSTGSVERVSLPELWQQVQARLQPQLACNDFETWIKPTRLLDLDDREAVIGTPNVFVRQELEQRYRDLLATTLGGALGRPVALLLTIWPPAAGGGRA